jgi:hypothetical protein
MTTQPHQPWKPTCWVGGIMVTSIRIGDHWINCGEQQLCELGEDSRAKYAATKATAAILRSMRK